MHTAFIGLSTNLGNKQENLSKAIQQINQHCKIIQSSQIYQTTPWGILNQPNFYNQCLEIQTRLSALELLNFFLAIEQKLKRNRIVKYGPRIIDLDILFFNNQIISEPNLKIPHPLIQERQFVLIPLQEIAPNLIHPIFNKTITELQTICQDQGSCQPL